MCCWTENAISPRPTTDQWRAQPLDSSRDYAGQGQRRALYLALQVPTGCKDGVAVSESDLLAHLLEEDMLHEDEDGSDLVSEHVRVGSCRQPLASHRNEIESTGKLVEVMRMAWYEKLECGALDFSFVLGKRV